MWKTKSFRQGGVAVVNHMSGKKKLTTSQRFRKLGHDIVENRWLYVLVLPALVYIILFNYLPMYGVQIASKIIRR